MLAVAAGDGPMVDLLLNSHARLYESLSRDELDELEYTVRYRHTSIAEVLLAQGTRFGHLNYFLLAIRNHDTAMVRFLLENIAVPKCGSTRNHASEPVFLAFEQNPS